MIVVTPTRVIGGATTPEQRSRLAGAQNLAELMQSRGYSRKQLIKKLAEDYDVEVGAPQLSYWLKGTYSPNPRNQAAIAAVFGVPVHMIFPPVQLERAS